MSPQKRTPLFATVQAAGATFGEEAGWQIADAFGGVDDEIAAARHTIALVDRSGSGKILLEGKGATAALQAAWDTPSLAVDDGALLEAGAVYRLRDDLYFVSTPPGEEETRLTALEAAAQESAGQVTVTDVTHGRSEVHLIGPNAADLLSRLCGLDFYPAHFPDGTAKQSRVAKTNQIIIRRDLPSIRGGAPPLPSYALIGGRSLAAYLWETILEAGRDLSVTPIGRSALKQLGDGGT